MEIIISSLIGAISAIIVSLINKKRESKKRDSVIGSLIKELNVSNNNVYLMDYKKPKEGYKFTSSGSLDNPQESETRFVIIR